jgi:Fe-S-cluster containining protein
MCPSVSIQENIFNDEGCLLPDRRRVAGKVMRVVPWSQVSSWRCRACGKCCREYDVVLKFPEWLSIVKNFGVEYTASSISKFLLRRRADGSCPFLYQTPTLAFCALQHSKPQACRLWPFKVLDRPRYGTPDEAQYRYGNRKLYVYVDTACLGLKYGAPTREYTYSVISEFVQTAFGVRRRQFKSTARL